MTTVLGPRSSSKTVLGSCADGQRTTSVPWRGEERDLLTPEKLLTTTVAPAAPKPRIQASAIASAASARSGHDRDLARGTRAVTTSGAASRQYARARRIVKSGRPRRIGTALRQFANAFEPSMAPRGPTGRAPGAARGERVPEPRHERHFGPDDREIDPLPLSEAHDRLVVVHGHG